MKSALPIISIPLTMTTAQAERHLRRPRHCLGRGAPVASPSPSPSPLPSSIRSDSSELGFKNSAACVVAANAGGSISLGSSLLLACLAKLPRAFAGAPSRRLPSCRMLFRLHAISSAVRSFQDRGHRNPSCSSAAALSSRRLSLLIYWCCSILRAAAETSAPHRLSLNTVGPTARSPQVQLTKRVYNVDN